MEKSRDDLFCELAHYRALLAKADNDSLIRALKKLIQETEETLGWDQSQLARGFEDITQLH